MAPKKTDAKLEADSAAVLAYLREDANEGEDTSSEIAAVTMLSLARVNVVLDALRRGGAVVEEYTVRNTRTGDTEDVWAIPSNRGWAKLWALRSRWDESMSGAVLPNGRQALPSTRSWGSPIPESFRANWEAAD